ncbi:BatD family protein [Candidatus Kaistella beijingensis]|uniref:BatD family protein n=1 Tax=Candidatus Kaistella beijingensis TaxID=2820270 RepID=UPI001CC4AFE7|nr:BatD family protein [Candidatus Kaistella beijingensis]UBB90878.1 BatD family protein [Candidatus Kaistella beijingensis]
MKLKFLYILSLFSAIFAHGQVTLAVSDVKDAKVNQRLNLTVLLEISGENMQQETPLRMPDLSKFDIIGTASEQNTVVLDAKKGDVLNQMVYQWVLSPKQSGKIKFGSVLVTVNGKIYKTEPFDINVRDVEKKTSVADNSTSNDLYLSLEVQDREVYKNESTIAILRAHSRDYGSFRNVGNIQVPQQKNARIKPISFAKSEIESSAGMNSQVLAVFMIFPSEEGNIEINPVTASISNSNREAKIVSNRVKLNVKKLPAGMPETFKNAVGKFDIAVVNNNSTEVSEIQKPVNVTMKVSGAGNFGTLHLPKIVSSNDYIFYPPKITARTTTHQNELSGVVTADYVVVPKKAGLVSINFEDFSFFNPTIKKYVDLGAKSISLDVKTPEEIAAAKSTLEKVNDYTNTVLETVNTPVLQTHNLKVKDKNSINWKVVFGNFALLTAFIAMFFVVVKRREKRKLKPQVAEKNFVSIAETEDLIRKDLNNSVEENIEYLKKLKDNKDFATFFSVYNDLVNETKKRNLIQSESDFRRFLEQNKGQQFADQYRVLSEQIQFERFAPFHSEERIEELFNSISTIFSEINK